MKHARTRLLGLLVLLGAAGAGAWFVFVRAPDPDAPPPPPEHVAIANDNFALLVGCTEYPELEKVSEPGAYASTVRLLGPGNDVVLMRSVLHRYLGVPEANIRVLTGWPDDPAARPTRANVLASLDRLARAVPRGARVLFLFAGHGSQQPDEPGGDEADGTDEILLPADSGRWDPNVNGISNAITDDEIRVRLRALRDAGAEVFAVFDCCHSGTIMRGTPDAEVRPDFGPVRARGLPPDLLGVPRAVSVGAARGGVERVGGVLQADRETVAGIAAISAAHSWEQAPEMVLPHGRSASGREAHGLCTFQVARALQYYGGRLTIAEIFAHVRAAYASMPWREATPVVEGDLSLRVTSGVAAGAPVLLLRREAGRLLLDAGSLRGLTVGSVLEAYRLGGFGDPTASLGRLTLTEVEPLYSTCGGVPGGPEPSRVPNGAPCRLVEVVPGGPPLRLALIDATEGPMPGGRARRSPSVAFLDAATRAQFPFVDPAEADWNLRELVGGTDGVARFALGPADPGAGIEAIEVASVELALALARVRRAEGLRGMAANDARFRLPAGVTVEASFRRHGADGLEPLLSGVALVPGDVIVVRVANGTGRDVDVVVKCLDATQTESHAWPQGESCRRLTEADRAPVAVDELEVSDDGIGRESLIMVVAVRAPGTGLLDVGGLSGSALPASVGEIAKRQGEHALLETVAPGGGRGVDDASAESVAIHEIAWTTTWGRISVPTAMFEGMAGLDPPVVIGPGAAGGAAVPGRQATWRSVRVVRGDADTADVLLLSGDGEMPGEGALGILVDEDGDAGLATADPVVAARQAAAGRLPVELMVVLESGRSSAAYPRVLGDGALGHVRVGSGAPDRDRAARRLDLGAHGWAARETCGAWLSTSFVPFRGTDVDARRSRVVAALRRFARKR